MEVKDLVGLHKLSGVDMSHESIKTLGDSFEDANVINFVLDKKTYTATEDPSDGYRSSMRDIVVTDFRVRNTFPIIRVMGIMRANDTYGDENDVVDFYDVETAKVVLSVGTRNTDDYYPSFVAEFTPENMATNQS